MLAHIVAVKALLTPLGYAVYYVDVPTTPAFPYLLLWSSGGAPGVEQAVDDVRLDIDTTIGVTAVATTPDGALLVQGRVRGVLAPGGLPVSLTVTGRSARLRLADSQPVAVDTDVTIVATGKHPAYSVDLYRLVSVPA